MLGVATHALSMARRILAAAALPGRSCSASVLPEPAGLRFQLSLLVTSPQELLLAVAGRARNWPVLLLLVLLLPPCGCSSRPAAVAGLLQLLVVRLLCCRRVLSAGMDLYGLVAWGVTGRLLQAAGAGPALAAGLVGTAALASAAATAATWASKVLDSCCCCSVAWVVPAAVDLYAGNTLLRAGRVA